MAHDEVMKYFCTCCLESCHLEKVNLKYKIEQSRKCLQELSALKVELKNAKKSILTNVFKVLLDLDDDHDYRVSVIHKKFEDVKKELYDHLDERLQILDIILMRTPSQMKRGNIARLEATVAMRTDAIPFLLGLESLTELHCSREESAAAFLSPTIESSSAWMLDRSRAYINTLRSAILHLPLSLINPHSIFEWYGPTWGPHCDGLFRARR